MTNTSTAAPRFGRRDLPKAGDFKPLTRITDPARNHKRGTPRRRKIRVIL